MSSLRRRVVLAAATLAATGGDVLGIVERGADRDRPPAAGFMTQLGLVPEAAAQAR